MSLPWHHHVRRHTVRVCGILTVVVFFLLAAVAAAIITFSTMFTAEHPLDLTPFLPRLNDYLVGHGLKLEAANLSTYYSHGNVVLAGRGLHLYGTDGVLAMVIDQGAVELSRRRLFFLIPAPKRIDADGVTARLIRNDKAVWLGGLKLFTEDGNGGSTDMGGIVDTLNGLKTELRWGQLEEGSLTHVTVLLEDDVQQAEWALEGGDLGFTQGAEGGEQARLTASLRRLYGGNKRILTTPVVVTFDHAEGADDAMLHASFEQSDVSMVADYFPEQLRNAVKAKGRVEMGVLIQKGNRLGQPWLTLRLTDVTITPPEAAFSHPFTFKSLDVTASYQPTPTDVLTINGISAEDARGNTVKVRGTATGITTGDPTLDVTLQAPRGEAQQMFDYFPDKVGSFANALEWLRPNIKPGTRFSNLVLHYAGKPSTFPFCGTSCGLTITARVDAGTVQYLPGLPVATVRAPGTFSVAGETLRVFLPKAESGSQKADNVDVTLGELFSPVPTVLGVKFTIAGPLDDVIKNVGKIEAPLPLAATGTQSAGFTLSLPLGYQGRETRITDADIAVSATITGMNVTRLDDLPGLTLTAPKASFSMAGPTARLEAPQARVGAYPLAVTWQDDWKHAGVKAMQVTAKGQLDSSLFKAQIPSAVSLTGPLDVNATLTETATPSTTDVSGFKVSADATDATVSLSTLNWNKPAGQPLKVIANGTYQAGVSGTIRSLSIPDLAVSGGSAAIKGAVQYSDVKPATNRVVLNPFRLGDNDVAVSWIGKSLNVTGRRLDLRGLDFASDESTTLPDLTLNLDVGRMRFARGSLEGAKAVLTSTNNVVDIGSVNATHNGGKLVQVTQTPLAGQPGRRRMTVNIQDLGGLLNTLDLYNRLVGGTLSGEINYDAPKTGGGVLTLSRFELDNPPVLVRLLSLLSLQQLLAGTDRLMFDKATIPVRLDGPMLYLDNMNMDGPAMSLRLDGAYNRDRSYMNINGKLAPAIPFNRLVSKIPLIGTLLTGSQDGVVVADFKMKGQSSNPDISVSPLSVLTPGLLKDLFHGLDSKPKKRHPKVESNVK
jgi:hypothetical protein